MSLFALLPVVMDITTTAIQGLAVKNSDVKDRINVLCRNKVTGLSDKYPGLNVRELRTICRDDELNGLKTYIVGTVACLVIHVFVPCDIGFANR
jgi:hypothetical protein